MKAKLDLFAKFFHVGIVGGLLLAVILEAPNGIFVAVCFLLGRELGDAIMNLTER